MDSSQLEQEKKKIAKNLKLESARFMQTQERAACEDEQNSTVTRVSRTTTQDRKSKSLSERHDSFPRCARTHAHARRQFTSGGEEIRSDLCTKPINTHPHADRLYSPLLLSKSPARCWMTSGTRLLAAYSLKVPRTQSKNISVECRLPRE